ncbi:MAG: chalcone isomerase family protein [Chromatiaceae bacterium]|nr:chalcone isomerase family protein [Gammaproteobacteria bacterium]MCP5300409.1 chalcone isomerase family protein [Chromatiaceae bacterium]MCP5422481.1 chalcone isomerase family protein [Chromatiaceae bacterium]
MRPTRLTVMLATLLIPALVGATEVAGVQVPERVQIDGIAAPLVLNGAGVRKKFFISVYVGALYLPQRQRDAAPLLASPPANRVSMHFVYSRVAKHKIDEGWREGFEANLDAASRGAVAARLERFVDLFPDLVEGDRVWIDFVPGLGTRVSINGESRGVIEGDDFNAALLTIWLGREPVSEALKNAMLGVDTP